MLFEKGCHMGFFLGNHGMKALVLATYSLYFGLVSFSDRSNNETPDILMIR